MMRHKKKRVNKSKFAAPPQAMKLEGDMALELTKFVRRGSMKVEKKPLQGVGSRFRAHENKDMAFGATSADDLDDNIPHNLAKEPSLADLINDSAVKGREQRRLLFEKVEEERGLKKTSVTDHVMQVLHHTFEYPRSVLETVKNTAKSRFTRASHAVEDSLQQLTSTSGGALRIGDVKRLTEFFAKLPQERIRALCNRKDKEGKRPLHWAAGEGLDDVAKVFHKYSNTGSINDCDEIGWSPLHCAGDSLSPSPSYTTRITPFIFLIHLTPTPFLNPPTTRPL